MSALKILSGGCSCGRIRFETRATPETIAACHCQDCRRHTGAPFAVYVDLPLADVKLTGAPIDWFETSPGSKRGFCMRCGATLAFQGANLPHMIHIHVGAFDEAAELPPVRDENLQSRLPWIAPVSKAP